MLPQALGRRPVKEADTGAWLSQPHLLKAELVDLVGGRPGGWAGHLKAELVDLVGGRPGGWAGHLKAELEGLVGGRPGVCACGNDPVHPGEYSSAACACVCGLVCACARVCACGLVCAGGLVSAAVQGAAVFAAWEVHQRL